DVAVPDIEAGSHRDRHVDDDRPQEKWPGGIAAASDGDQSRHNRGDGRFRSLVQKGPEKIGGEARVRALAAQKAPASVGVALRQGQTVQVSLRQNMEIVRQHYGPA